MNHLHLQSLTVFCYVGTPSSNDKYIDDPIIRPRNALIIGKTISHNEGADDDLIMQKPIVNNQLKLLAPYSVVFGSSVGSRRDRTHNKNR